MGIIRSGLPAFLLLGVAGPVDAVQLFEFGGVMVAGQGQFSSYVPQAQHETFTNRNPVVMRDCLYGQFPTQFFESDVTSFSDFDQGIPDFQQGSIANRRLAPTGSDASNCFAIVNSPDHSDLFDPARPADGAFATSMPGDTNYFGFYWGSVDAYNYLALYDSNQQPLVITGPNGENWGTVLSGDEVTAASGIAAPDSVYVNFTWNPLVEDINYVVWGSSNWAFEFDNYAVTDTYRAIVQNAVGPAGGQGRATDVPAPATLALFGGALAGLAGGRRR